MFLDLSENGLENPVHAIVFGGFASVLLLKSDTFGIYPSEGLSTAPGRLATATVGLRPVMPNSPGRSKEARLPRAGVEGTLPGVLGTPPAVEIEGAAGKPPVSNPRRSLSDS